MVANVKATANPMTPARLLLIDFPLSDCQYSVTDCRTTAFKHGFGWFSVRDRVQAQRSVSVSASAPHCIVANQAALEEAQIDIGT
jgi:hypothetical protein